MTPLSRRNFLKLVGLATLGAAGACQSNASVLLPSEPAQPNGKKRVLRIAHMTDFHVWSLGGAPDGMKRALRHAQTQEDPPDIIVNTGDSIMDSLEHA